MIKRKYIVLSLLTLVSIMLGSLLCSNLVKANSTVTGYLSVPAAAFVAGSNYVDAYNSGWSFFHIENTTEYFFGPVQLPSGATVTKVTFYWWDNSDQGDIVCRLKMYNQTHHPPAMAEMWSGGADGSGSSYNDTINYATIDNSKHAYYLEVGIPGAGAHGTYFFEYVTIEYTLPVETAGVGGYYIPVDKWILLTPYIALVSTIILAISMSVAYIKYRKEH